MEVLGWILAFGAHYSGRLINNTMLNECVTDKSSSIKRAGEENL